MSDLEGIAIIGLAGRFPGAANVDAFWQNLIAGRESITTFTAAELAAAGGDPAELRHDPHYVPARGIIEEADCFDAAFFGVNPREAEVTDPQHRVFLETAWTALEHAGYDPANCPGSVGVFAGMTANTYHHQNLLGRRDLLDLVGPEVVLIGNERDYLATRVAYKLNLRGPAVNIATACSTSLVAVCEAVTALLNYQCDLALAGGVSITFPQKRGHLFQEGGIRSLDGHTRAYDAQARGMVMSDGVGVVVLKRLAGAVADRDQIWAVIKGSALNNDGSGKVSFTAPSVEGHAEVVALAQAVAGFAPRSISYIEGHGTATPLGDPIEIAGLTRAFRAGTAEKGFCALGSVKSNIGHLDVAAGVAGLIKTALALQHRQLPASLHFTAPNPAADLANSPFYVNTARTDWPAGETPRRAGVSSLGLGGTNAHVVLEEAPAMEVSPPSRAGQLLVLSARTPTALDAATRNLAAYFRAHPEASVADAAFTLQTGRSVFAHRRTLVCRDAADAAAALETREAKHVFTRQSESAAPPVVFLFPGQGAQHAGMGMELYASEPFFRAEMDRCAEILRPLLGLDLREVLRGPAEQLGQTRYTQPALFVIEYALAQLWMSWGVQPAALLGHSVGEYVAACLAGVFSLEDALRLVAARAELVQAQPPGAMLAVRLRADELLLDRRLSLAAINAPTLCVVSGPFDAIAEFETQLTAQGTAAKRLETSHAFHSTMMEPVLAPFTALLEKVALQPPRIPYVSNVTARWITDAEATSATYWAGHVCQTVRFAEGAAELLKDPRRVLLEVGPGQTLSTLARQQAGGDRIVLASFTARDEPAAVLTALGKLWLAGVEIDWKGFRAGENRGRVPLPTYPFERQRYFVEPASVPAEPTTPEPATPGTSTPALPAGTKPSLLSKLETLFRELSGIAGAWPPEKSFLEMGLDSLLLTQASLALQRKFGVKISFRQLLDDLATLGTLAAFIEATAPTPPADQRACPVAARPAPADVAGFPPENNPHADGSALTGPQREIWFPAQMHKDASCAFNNNSMIELRGPLQATALREALQEITDRHDALRTTFDPSGLRQDIAPKLTIELPLTDLSTTPHPEQELPAWLAAEHASPFDLARGPLLRARLVKLEETHHVLFLGTHHLAVDGWSGGVMLDELKNFYALRSGGGGHPLEPALQYRDYARWLDGPEHAAASASSEQYWLRKFADLPAAVDLPTSRPRQAGKTYRAETVHLRLGDALSHTVRQAAAQQGCTLLAWLLAGFNVWLHRLSGQRDIVVGVPSAGQLAAGDLAGSRALVGHCVHLLPVRTECRVEQTFAEFLATVKRELLDALEHQNFTLGSLIEKLNPRREAGRTPLVSVILNIDHTRSGYALPGLQTRITAASKAFVFFDLDVNFIDAEAELRLDCSFNADLFDHPTVCGWLENLRTLLADAATNPGKTLDRIELLPEAQRRQLLVQWNDTVRSYPSDQTVHALIEAQVERTPEAGAVVFAGKSATYRELNERANQLARHLRTLGVGPDVVVGLSVERSLEMVIALLAILKAGGAYIPLDPSFPQERLAFMVEDAALTVLVTERRVAERIGQHSAQVVWLDEFAWQPEPENPPHLGTPASRAYVIYTSGSTGKSKGVEISHQALVNCLCHFQQSLDLRPDDAWLAVTTLSFDIAGLEIWLPLLAGARVIIATRETAMDGRLLSQAVIDHGATVLQATPATWQGLLYSGWQGHPKLQILCGGEAMPQELAERLAVLGSRAWNVYGPTETTIWSTSTQLVPNRPVNIGSPLANTQIYVLDTHLQPVPVGVPGELCIGGDGVALGYRNRPELTAERFVPDPYGTKPGARIYKTGDQAKWLADGRVDFLGRSDFQVKIRGFRIELGEIETALRARPEVREAVVVVQESVSGDKRLVACLIAQADKKPDAATLRERLAARLPEYMLPNAFVWLDQLPRTPNGKVDRKALEMLDGAEASPRTDCVPARNALEAQLVEIWMKVLNRFPIGIYDDFFDIGGHSLLAARVISLIETRMGERLSFGEFFDHPTIARHALRLAQAKAPEAPARPPAYTAIHPSGQKTPVFFFHGDVLGGGMFCKVLAEAIGADRPFYILHPHGLQGDEIPQTVEAMVAERLRWIRQLQPQGPYILGGYCNGGLTAYETARVLRDAGEEVNAVLMLHPNGSNIRFRLLRRWCAVQGALRGQDEMAQRSKFLQMRDAYCDHEAMGRHYLMAGKAWIQQPPREQAARLWRKTRRIMRHLVPKTPAELATKLPATAPRQRHKEAIMNIYDDIFRAFIPGRYDSPVVLFWPEEETGCPVSGWRKICPRLEIVNVPGDHNTCVAQHVNVAQIGAAMRKSIALRENLLTQQPP